MTLLKGFLTEMEVQGRFRCCEVHVSVILGPDCIGFSGSNWMDGLGGNNQLCAVLER